MINQVNVVATKSLLFFQSIGWEIPKKFPTSLRWCGPTPSCWNHVWAKLSSTIRLIAGSISFFSIPSYFAAFKFSSMSQSIYYSTYPPRRSTFESIVCELPVSSEDFCQIRICSYVYWWNHSIQKLLHPRKLDWKESWGQRQFFSSWVHKIPYNN